MKTEIIAILDRSGSMDLIVHDAIGGFNSFLKNQKNQEGEAKYHLSCLITIINWCIKEKISQKPQNLIPTLLYREAAQLCSMQLVEQFTNKEQELKKKIGQIK